MILVELRFNGHSQARHRVMDSMFLTSHPSSETPSLAFLYIANHIPSTGGIYVGVDVVRNKFL